MSLKDDLAVKLITAGTLTVVGTDAFVSLITRIPPGDGPYTSFVETPGGQLVRRHRSKYEQPSVQITVRAKSSPVAEAKALAHYAALAELFNVTINGSFYLQISPVQKPFEMPVDDVGRARWTFNVDTLKSY